MISFKKLSKSFATISASYKEKIFLKIKNVFLLLSDGDLKPFLKQFCTETEFGKNEIVPICNDYQIKPIIENILQLYYKALDHQKPTILALIANQYTWKQMVYLGFIITRKQHSLAVKKSQERIITLNKYKRYIPAKSSKITQDIKDKIINTCLKNSHISSNQSKQTNLNLTQFNYCEKMKFYLSKTKKTLFSIFSQLYPNISICQSSFYKYIPSNFFFSKKRTDVCPICSDEIPAKKSLEHYKLIDASKDIIQKASERIETIYKHCQIKEHQKNMFNYSINNLKDKDCILMIDFKENLKIGGGPEETKKMFFNKEQISVLGIALIYLKSGKKEIDYYTYLSNQLTHDSRFAGHCLIDIFKKKIKNKFNSINLWSDGGNHFKSSEFLAFQMNIANEISGCFKHDFFAEYHGKNYVDGHFGRLSQWFKKIELYHTINDIFQLKQFFEKEKEERVSNKDFSDSSSRNNGHNYFIIYEVVERTTKRFLSIKGIKNYLSFIIIKDLLFASFITKKDNLKYELIDFKIVSSADTRLNKLAPQKNSNLPSDLYSTTGKNYRVTLQLRYEDYSLESSIFSNNNILNQNSINSFKLNDNT